ncbi:hypothetical protein [Micromonospora sp. NPDC049274]|uniref:hypothetical protein n=1 Tax=Micromonospora sp. NPDC049274 TaxID=3154829 RepID=UPI0034304CFE
MSPSKTALHPRSADGGGTTAVAAILAAVLVSVGMVATSARAADAYTQVYEFSYSANEEPLIEEGFNESYDAQYHDSVQGFLLSTTTTCSSGAFCARATSSSSARRN